MGCDPWNDKTRSRPFDFELARPFRYPSLYAARLVRDGDNGWALTSFRNIENGRFVGELTDPIPVRYEQAAGAIRVRDRQLLRPRR